MDPTQRFSDRVANYIKYRPPYPAAIIPYLEAQIGFSAKMVVADVGSGTGILTELFLRNGNAVYAVEPNGPMRTAAVELLSAYEYFTSVDGSAEETNLHDASVGLVVAGQAFHWFDPPKARKEFSRILGAGGKIVLIWNSRRLDRPFMQGYEQILHRFADNYGGVSEHNILDEHIEAFFLPQPVTLHTLNNVQTFDFEGLKGRALSSSYSPAPGTPMHAAFIEQMQRLFDDHQKDGTIRIEYITRVYCGGL